jgi:hypothetical protein
MDYLASIVYAVANIDVAKLHQRVDDGDVS